MRVVLRFLGTVVAVTGLMLIADAALTLAWQEPFSALLTQREQSRLRDELSALEPRFRPAGSQPRDSRRLAARYQSGLRSGDAVGRIELPTLGRKYAIVEGTDRATLRRGPAHYPNTGLPGQGRTVAVAGHRTTYLAPFRTLDRLRARDRIVVRMPYGRFVYRVERTRIVAPTATWVTRDVGAERLVLTACHPLYSAKQRIVVFARLAGRDRTAAGRKAASVAPAKTPRPPGPIRRVSAGQGASGALIAFRGALRAPRPVLVFLHGWGVPISAYTAWIDHLVRVGNTVVAPRYQTSVRERPDRVLGSALAGVRGAFRRIEVAPGSLVVAGHSAGGALGADLAGSAGRSGLPRPRAVVAVYPGRAILGYPGGIPAVSLAGLPSSTRLLVLAGANDAVVGEAPARGLVQSAISLPRGRRRLVRLTDARVDDHFAPTRAGKAARRSFWDRLDRVAAAARRDAGANAG